MLEQAWLKHRELLRSLSAGILTDPWSVEDALQESFARAFKSGQRFENDREAFYFLQRVVLNTSIDFYRYQKRQRRRFPLVDRPFLAKVAASRNPGNWVLDPSPLALMIDQERHDRRASFLNGVQQALQRIPPEQRQAIEVMFDPARTPRHASTELGIPYSTLRSRMMLGVEKIRRHLRRRQEFRSLLEEHDQ